jgi:hypothetical protein
MATLLDSPAFTGNEVYAIQSTDAVEGAATGASFNGIGVSNQPHQQLANRTSFLKQRQDVNIANIATLQSFNAMFRGLMSANGYLQIPFVDINRGLTTATIQWGGAFPSGGLADDQSYSVIWPVAFPTACLFALASLSNSKADSHAGKYVMETVSLSVTAGVFMSDLIGNQLSTEHTNDGFYWIAIGF